MHFDEKTMQHFLAQIGDVSRASSEPDTSDIASYVAHVTNDIVVAALSDVEVDGMLRGFDVTVKSASTPVARR
jgi:hypothetical protein